MRRFALALVALTPALALALDLASGVKPREELRPIAEEFAKDGDLEKALAALEKKKAKPLELLATLRAPAPAREAEARSLEIEDGYGTKTELLVWAPRGKGPLPLVVLLHGLGGKGKNAEAMGLQLAAMGCVAVAPSAQAVPANVGAEDGAPDAVTKRFPHWWLYTHERVFALEAIRRTRAMFPIDPDRVCLSGMSMGGYGTWNIGLRHPDVFAGIAPLAGNLSRLESVGMKHEPTWSLLENGLLLPIMAVHGDKDSVVPYGPDKEAADRLKSLGASIDFRTLEGVDHSLAGVPAGVGATGKDVMTFLAKQKRNPAPKKVAYVSIAEPLDGAYWLRVAKRKKTQVKVAAEIDSSKNIVAVSGTAETARVYLDDRLLDFKKNVTVRVGDKESTVAPKPDFRAILESWRSRRDERLVYAAFVEVDLE